MKEPSRRLVRAYPPGPRREEILDMLVQAHGPGTAPSWRTRGNLVRYGLRARLGRPAGTSVVWAAALVSLVAAFLFACAAEAVVWTVGPGVPDLRSVAAVVSPGQPVREDRDSFMIVPADSWREYFTGTDDEDRYGVQWLTPSLPAGTDPGEWLRTTRERLEAAGWRYRGSGEPSYDQSFVASRDGYFVQVGVSGMDGEVTASVTVGRTMPWWMSAILILAALAGAFSGWLSTGWISRRTEHRGKAVRAVSTILTSIILTLMTPLALIGLSFEVSNILSLRLPPVPPWIVLFKVYFWGMFATSMISTGIVLLIAVTGPRRKDDTVPIAS